MELPKPINRRSVLWGTVSANHVALGDEYFAQERYAEAIDFYARAEHQPGIESIERVARENGDVFLLEATERLTREVPTDIWRQTAEQAERTGKLRYALRAFEHLGDAEGCARLRAAIGLPEPEPEESADA